MMAKPADKNIQSGNSRVKVTIYGQVNRAVRYASSGSKSDVHSVDNGESNSRIGIRAVGKLNKSMTAVAWSEWAMAAGGGRGTGFGDDGKQGNAGSVSIRHSVVNLSHKDMGTVSLGHSTRADASAIFTGFQGTGIVFHGGGPGNIDGGLMPESDTNGVMSGKIAGGRIGVPTNVYPGRENRILVRSPNLMGASLAASFNQNRSWSLGGSFKSPASMSKDISVALGFGYRSQLARAKTDHAMSTIGVSGGIQHNPTGLSINGVWAQESVKSAMTAATKPSRMVMNLMITADDPATPDTDETAYATGVVVTPGMDAKDMAGYRHSGWAADLSWTGKVTDAGSTSFTVGYGQYREGSHKQTKGYWVAFNQRVDSAAADVYFGASYDTGQGAYTVSHKDGGVWTVDGTTNVATQNGANATYDQTCGDAAWSTDLNGDGTTTTDDIGVDGVKNGTVCSVDRKPVLVLIAGVRIKF